MAPIEVVGFLVGPLRAVYLRLYLGPARNGDLLEIVTVVRDDDTEVAIHAMKMRAKYQRLLPET